MTIEENKRLISRYPFLQPRNVWTDKISEDYDYSYIRGIGEIPHGWNELFLQMCEDIREPLIEAGCLHSFRFTQIKEKNNRMCCYCHGAPAAVHDILHKYEHMAQYVCTHCGKPATHETCSYYASYCKECLNRIVRWEKSVPIKLKTTYKVIHGFNGVCEEKIVSFEDEWRRLYNL